MRTMVQLLHNHSLPSRASTVTVLHMSPLGGWHVLVKTMELPHQAAVAWCHHRQSSACLQVLVKADCKLLHQHYAGLLLPVHSALAGRRSAATLMDAVVSDPSAKVRLPKGHTLPEPPAALQMGASAGCADLHDCMWVAAGSPLTNSCQASIPLAVPVMPRFSTGQSSCCHHGGHAVGGRSPTQLPGNCRADELKTAAASQVRFGCVACKLQLDTCMACQPCHAPCVR